nr:MAG TPA: hypothetical protein [Caudoviricetes sp.]
MTCLPLHTPASVDAAFWQCYTVCCTGDPLKTYGQDAKSRTRCQFSSARDGMTLDFPTFCAVLSAPESA